jgi:hypothetical protein
LAVKAVSQNDTIGRSNLVAGMPVYPADQTVQPGEHHLVRYLCVRDITCLFGRMDLENTVVQLVSDQLIREWRANNQSTHFAYVWGSFFIGETFEFESVFDVQRQNGDNVLIPYMAGRHYQLLNVNFSEH